MTQGKVLTASFATKNGAFCISFSIVNLFTQLLCQDKIICPELQLHWLNNEQTLNHLYCQMIELFMLTSASSLMNFVSICFCERVFKCLSIILETLLIQQQEHVIVHVREKEMEREVNAKKHYSIQKHTCIDRTPYGKNDKSLFHFQ